MKKKSLTTQIHHIYQFCQSHPVPSLNTERPVHMPNPDPDAQLATILSYAQNSAAYITAADALITQLQTAQDNSTDSDSTDVQAAIQAILTFQASNPVPTLPTGVTPAPAPVSAAAVASAAATAPAAAPSTPAPPAAAKS